MKTMKNVLNGDISRVTEDKVRVKLGDGWDYCPKSEWKSLHAPKPSKPSKSVTVKKGKSGKKKGKIKSDEISGGAPDQTDQAPIDSDQPKSDKSGKKGKPESKYSRKKRS